MLLIIGGIFLIFLLWYFRVILTYVLISVVLAFLGRPLVKWLSMVKYKKFRIPPSVAAFVTLIVIWVVFISFFRFIIPLLIKELSTFSEIDFKSLLEYFEEPVTKVIKLTGGEPFLVEGKTFSDILIEQLSAKIDFSRLTDVFAVVAGTLGQFFIGFFSVSFITFFFLREKNMFKEAILLIVPTEIEERVTHILDSVSHLLRRYFVGIVLEVFMIMLLVSIGLILVGLNSSHAIIIGLFCGLFNIIPYLGPWMGAFLGFLVAAGININADFMSHTLPLLGLMAVVFISVQIIDNVLFQPYIYSSSVKAHPLEIFLVILAAGSMAGILGMILAIPVYTILRVIGREFFINMKFVRKLTENLEKQKVN